MCVAVKPWPGSFAGGPSGGNGGKGGNVWLEADISLNSLTSFRKQVHYRATGGTHGGGSNMTGADGPDLTIKVAAQSWLLIVALVAGLLGLIAG